MGPQQRARSLARRSPWKCSPGGRSSIGSRENVRCSAEWQRPKSHNGAKRGSKVDWTLADQHLMLDGDLPAGGAF
eukprot:862121-Pyramimonas_sp.AAC.1